MQDGRGRRRHPIENYRKTGIMTEEQPQSTAVVLSLSDRAALALRTEERTDSKLIELARASASITTITNKAGRDQCHSARMGLKNARLDIAHAGEAARDEARKFADAVIVEERRLIGLIEPEEKRLKKIQDDYDAEQERIKQEEAERERQRIEQIQSRIENDIRGAALGAVGRKAADIEAIIRDVEAIAIDDWFAELKQTAEGAKAVTLIKLRAAHAAAAAHEAEQTRVAAERAELERARREHAEREEIERKRQAEEAELGRMRMQDIHGIQQQVMIASMGRAGVRKGGTRECIVDTLSETRAWPVTEAQYGPLASIAESTKVSAIAQIEQLLVQWDERAEEERRAAIWTRIGNIRMPDGISTQSSVFIQKALDDAESFGIDAGFAEFAADAQAAKDEVVRRLTAILAERKTFEDEQARLAAQRAELDRIEAQQRAEREERERIEAQKQAERDAEERRLKEQRAELERQQEEWRKQQERVNEPPQPETIPQIPETIAAAPETMTAPIEPTKPRRPPDDEILQVICDEFVVDRETAIEWLRTMNLDAGHARAEPELVDIVFDGPPDLPAPRFVEVEDGTGKSIRVGDWIERNDGYWALRLPVGRAA